MLLSQLGERALLGRIRALAPAPGPDVLVGIGDDAAAFEKPRNELLLATSDTLVEAVHFDRRFSPPELLGRKAFAINASDVAAMGGTPWHALLSLALPATLEEAFLDALLRGFLDSARAARTSLIGGNLSGSPGPIVIDVTLLGRVKRKHLTKRSGARPGDVLFLSGPVGGAGAGLALLREGVRANGRDLPETHSDSRNRSAQPPPASSPVRQPRGPSANEARETGREATASGVSGPGVVLASVADRSIRAYLDPQPPLRLATTLARARVVSAMIDLSDGLAAAVEQLAAASHAGARIDEREVPIDEGARLWAAARGRPPIELALSGGEDYELLVAVPPRHVRRLPGLARSARHAPLVRIGEVTAGAEVTLLERDGTRVPLGTGYQHFIS